MVPFFRPSLRIDRAGLALLLAATLAGTTLGGCAARGTNTPASAADRERTLAAAVDMPEASSYETHYLDGKPPLPPRGIAAKLYLPLAQSAGPVPLVVFSHGLGGSREGYSYLGKYWASKGYASLHLQHPGSDRSIWSGNPLAMVGRMHDAAQDAEAIARVQDLSAALDQLLASDLAPRI
ncbi:MAG: hypothetical protein RLZZ401_1550, partial [Pseudomonadota bacterium]